MGGQPLSRGAVLVVGGGTARPDRLSPLTGNWESDTNLVMPELYPELAAMVEGMVEFERRSAMQMIRYIHPWAGLDSTGMLGLWEVANEVTRRMSRPQPPRIGMILGRQQRDRYWFGPFPTAHTNRLIVILLLTVMILDIL